MTKFSSRTLSLAVDGVGEMEAKVKSPRLGDSPPPLDRLMSTCSGDDDDRSVLMSPIDVGFLRLALAAAAMRW